MRHFLSSLLILLCIPIALIAQDKDPIYTVEVGTFIQPKPIDFEGIADQGIVYTQSMGSNMEQVYLGGYTELNKASEIARSIRDKGYLDAQVVQLDPSRGRPVTVIQLRLHRVEDEVDWSNYAQAGKLFFILKDQYIKIVTGTYSSIAAAKEALPRIQKMGFSDAFVKNINSAFLHEVDDFIYTPPPTTRPRTPEQTPANYGQPTPRVPEDVPASYDQPAERIPATTQPDPAVPVFDEQPVVYRPDIRGKIKRNSVRELQAALTSEQVYSKAIDGYYGNGTIAAYSQAFEQNYQIQKYTYLSQKLDAGSMEQQVSVLQGAVDGLATDPQGSLALLRQSQMPIAKGYQAYHHFITIGPSLEVNTWMNRAIQEAFSNHPNPETLNFDYRSTYAYQDLGQLLQHLRHLHAAAANPEIAVPCWLFERHPQKALQAFRQDPNMSMGVVDIPNCAGFLKWKELPILIALARDINGEGPDNDVRIAQGRATMLDFALNPHELSDAQKAAARQWQNMLMIKLINFSAPSPMLADMAVAFKILYFQSLALLEDYYMDKGLEYEEAEALGIATMQAILAPHLNRFV